MSRPLVSAIMVAYNEEDYIIEAIEGVISQTYPNWELIICDDNSTDDTLKIIEDYERSYSSIFVLSNEERMGNQGIGKIRNKCIRESEGKYLAICDADDIRYPKSFEEEVKLLEKKLNVGVVGTYYDEINPKGEIIKTPSHFTLGQYTGHWIDLEEYRDEFGWRNSLGKKSSTELKQILLAKTGSYSAPLLPSSCMIRKNALNEVGYYNEEWKYHVDTELHRRIAKKYEIEIIPKKLCAYRQHPTKMSIDKWEKGWNEPQE